MYSIEYTGDIGIQKVNRRMCVCLFTIGRKAEGIRKKRKMFSYVKFGGEEHRLGPIALGAAVKELQPFFSCRRSKLYIFFK